MEITKEMVDYIFRDIIKNIGLQRHVHVDRARNPRKLALPYI